MRRITISNLRQAVEELNQRFEFNEESACMIKIHCAYGGYQIIVQQNMPYGSGAISLTTGYVSARECLDMLVEKDFSGRLKTEVYDYFIRTLSKFVKAWKD
ncbi:MAG: hypothetical protein IJZ77_02985 [Bacilli bacterium]|nr:hypothetical protein [Bacilli bacterium]